MKKSIFVCCGLLLLPVASLVAAVEPDFAREARMASEIEDVILDGEVEWLQADGREFMSIYTESDEPGTAVVILHGRGFHPDWIDAVNPLRVGLVETGYSTLSLQMPVLAKDATYYDYEPIFGYAFPRIEAGIRYLRDQGHDQIVLLAHSCGVHMAMAWIDAHGDRNIDAFIGLGMGATDFGQPMRKPFPLDGMRVPVLDLYGAEEYPAVVRAAPGRLAMIRAAGNPRSRQVVLPGANHYFTDFGDALVSEVAAWLEQLE